MGIEPQPEAVPVATIIACSEVDLDGNPIRARDIDWFESDIAELPIGTKLYVLKAPLHACAAAIRKGESE